MSITITLDEPQATLKDLVHQLAPGDEITIIENQQPVATLMGKPAPPRKPRVPGNCKGMMTLFVEDDEHLAGFKEYMPSSIANSSQASAIHRRSNNHSV